jgi:hypothetical protein
MKITKYAVITAVLALLPQYAIADMYKCSANGIVAYQAKPCADDSSQTVIAEKQPDKGGFYQGEVGRGILLSPISVEKEFIGTDGDQYISQTVTVTNETDSEREILLTYHGIDNEGSVVKDIHIGGPIQPHSTKSFTDHSFMSVPNFIRIKKWVLAH